MSKRLSFTFLIPVLTVVVGMTVVASQVQAGPVSGSGGSGPFVKLGVYQGTIKIIPPGGGNVMDIGNAGRDIATTGTLYIRPGGLPYDRQCVGGSNPGVSCPTGSECLDGGFCQTQAARLYKYPSFPEAAIDVGSGQVCLRGTGIADCRSIWPTAGGAGDPYWQTSNIGGLTVLVPNWSASPTPNTVRIGDPTHPVPSANGSALAVYSNYAGTAMHVLTDVTTNEYDASYTLIGSGTVLVNGAINAGRYDSFYEGLNIGVNVTPWTGVDNYNYKNPYLYDANTDDRFTSRIDADTFDSASLSSLPFPNNGNLFIKRRYLDNGPFFDPFEYEAICIQTSSSGLCIKGTSIGQPCSTDANCPSGGPGSCQLMCTNSQQICTPDRLYTTNPVQPTDTGKFCQNLKWTKNCWDSTGKKQYQIACTQDSQCTGVPGGSGKCLPTTCYSYSTCSAPAQGAWSCIPGDPIWGNTHCNTVAAGSTCTIPAGTCPSGGECRANNDTTAVVPGSIIVVEAGFCHQYTSCVDDAQCGGSAGGSSLCKNVFGYCTRANNLGTSDPVSKHCVGGTRKNYICQGGARNGQYCAPGYPGTISDCGGGTCVPDVVRCDETAICIGGIADSQYDSTAGGACANYNGYASTYPALGGNIGNAMDYCPGGGTCVPDHICENDSDCFIGEQCTKSLVIAPFLGGGSCNASICDSECNYPFGPQASNVVNRCRGNSDVFGGNINACAARNFGQDLRYSGGNCTSGYRQFSNTKCNCDPITEDRPYAKAQVNPGDICTPKFQP